MLGAFVTPTPGQIERLKIAVARSLEAPIVSDVMGFVWETAFAYSHNIVIRERSKRLFDVVADDGRGWSLKTIERNTQTVGSRIEYVVQRADIYSKGVELGFRGGLTQNSPTDALGDALVLHWNRKHRTDSQLQAVHDPYIAVLVKHNNRRLYTYVEAHYPEWDARDLTWSWSPPGADGREHVGLNGYLDGEPVLRWHPSGAQLFELVKIPPEAATFEVEWTERDVAAWFEGRA